METLGSAIFIEFEDSFDGELELNISNLNVLEGESTHGGIYIQNLKCLECLINNVNFSNNINLSGNGAGLYLSEVQGKFTLENSLFQDNRAKNGGAVFFQNVIDVSILNVDFQRNNGTENGGAIYANGDKNYNILLNESTFRTNFAETQNGGALYIEKGSNLNIKNCLLTKNFGQIRGGAIFLLSQYNANLDNLEVLDNYSEVDCGGICIHSGSFVYVNNSKFNHNYAHENMGGVEIAYGYKVFFDNCGISYNSVRFQNGGIMIQFSGDIYVSNSKIQGNQSGNLYAGINIYKAGGIAITNSEISDNVSVRFSAGLGVKYCGYVFFTDLLIQNNTSLTSYGGGIYSDSNEDLFFSGITILKNTAVLGGGMYNQISNDFSITNCTFQENVSTPQTGGGMAFVECFNMFMEGCNFFLNKAQESGGGIFLTQITNSIFSGNLIESNAAIKDQGGGIYIKDQCKNVTISESIFRNNTAILQGGGASLRNHNETYFYNTTFEKNYAPERGAGIFVEYVQQLYFNNLTSEANFQEDQNLLPKRGAGLYISNSDQINIVDSKFQKEVATQQGGSMYLTQVKKVKIQNSVFDTNFVQFEEDEKNEDFTPMGTYGGHIYIRDSESLILENSEFSKGHCYSRGGALYTHDLKVLEIIGSIFSDNYVHFDNNLELSQKGLNYPLTQGGDVYAECKELEKLQIKIENSKFEKSKASSGGSLFFNSNDKKINFEFNNKNEFKNIKADIGPILRVIGDTKIENIQKFEQNVKQQSTQNTGFILQDQMVFTGYYKNEYILKKNQSQYETCVAGEHLSTGGKQECDLCNDNGQCLGGYIPMYPKKYYWRKNTESQEFFYCDRNPGACLGKDVCLEGHTGLLCENCDILNNFAPEGDDKCLKCSDKASQIINIVLLFLLSVTLLINQIYGVNMRIRKRLIQRCLHIIFDYSISRISQLSGITKIFIMHCQVNYLVSTVSFDLPFEVTSFFQILGNPQKMFSNSLNCLLDVNNQEDLTNLGQRLAVVSLIMTVGIALFVVILEIFVFASGKIIKQKKNLFNFIKGSILCFFLTIQPGVLQNSLEFLNCRQIGDQLFSSGDSYINCESDFFNKEVLPLNLSVVLLLGFIFPILIGINLIRNQRQNKLKTVDFQKVYGILYMELKHKFYFWEIISTLIKMSIVVICILYDEKIVVKGILACIILGGYVYATSHFQPFITKKLNELSVIATFTQCITFALVICINQIDTYPNKQDFVYIKYTSLCIISILNLWFVCHSAKMMIMEYEWVYRSYVLRFIKNKNSKMLNSVLNKIQKEKTAKINLQKVKIGIKMACRDRKHNFRQEFFELILYEHLKKAFGSQQKLVKQSYLSAFQDNFSKSQHLSQKNSDQLTTLNQQQQQLQEGSKNHININTNAHNISKSLFHVKDKDLSIADLGDKSQHVLLTRDQSQISNQQSISRILFRQNSQKDLSEINSRIELREVQSYKNINHKLSQQQDIQIVEEEDQNSEKSEKYKNIQNVQKLQKYIQDQEDNKSIPSPLNNSESFNLKQNNSQIEPGNFKQDNNDFRIPTNSIRNNNLSSNVNTNRTLINYNNNSGNEQMTPEYQKQQQQQQNSQLYQSNNNAISMISSSKYKSTRYNPNQGDSQQEIDADFNDDVFQ